MFATGSRSSINRPLPVSSRWSSTRFQLCPTCARACSSCAGTVSIFPLPPAGPLNRVSVRETDIRCVRSSRIPLLPSPVKRTMRVKILRPYWRLPGDTQNGARSPTPMPRRATFRVDRGFPKLPKDLCQSGYWLLPPVPKTFLLGTQSRLSH